MEAWPDAPFYLSQREGPSSRLLERSWVSAERSVSANVPEHIHSHIFPPADLQSSPHIILTSSNVLTHSPRIPARTNRFASSSCPRLRSRHTLTLSFPATSLLLSPKNSCNI
ncbi:hypothetical protein DPEC_G00299660 [Dallia pectoralis]|uniref:Uncharacterized protein n=1 Tax=Dallia pectoralis TaxID=75939 RepID=A0ACC2FGF7_DALPE|nr:hypothetical protein DPEC_G00299660 [Dallia pectoralis]